MTVRSLSVGVVTAMGRVVLVLAVLCVIALSTPAVAQAQPAKPPAPITRCTLNDPRLGTLSGFTTGRGRWYAVTAGGEQSVVSVLRRNCTVERQIIGPTDPFDVQDLGRAQNGTLVLADGGDRNLVRDTVALIALTPDGATTLYRLTYPDRKHHAAAFLLGANGTPYFITQSTTGKSAAYAPTRQLKSPGPTPMRKVATITLTPTKTPGGPGPTKKSSVTITGGAVSPDGTVVALRTYTDAYLYPAPRGNIVKALTTEPVRVPLPDEAQGEAIAFARNGNLLSAPGRTGQPVRAIVNATDLVRINEASQQNAGQRPPESAPPRALTPPGDTVQQGIPVVPAVGIAILLVLLVLGGLRWYSGRSRRSYYSPFR
jgi:hypothetical protein